MTSFENRSVLASVVPVVLLELVSLVSFGDSSALNFAVVSSVFRVVPVDFDFLNEKARNVGADLRRAIGDWGLGMGSRGRIFRLGIGSAGESDRDGLG